MDKQLGIDIGGSHIGIGVVNQNTGEIIEKIEKDIEIRENIEEHILNYIENKIEYFLNKYSIEKIGIVAPGNPDLKNYTIENIVNLKIKKLDFSGIAKKFQIPIQINNDAKAAGIAEFRFGSLKNYNDSAFLCLGTGIGSAVFLNGKILEANKHIGFELGHMIIDKNGLQCNCGKKGCFETYCSMKRFKNNAKETLNISEVSPQELIELLRKNAENKEIEQLINEYIDNLIIGLSNIIDLFEPEAICLGGSFVYFKDIFYDKLVDEMNKRKYVFNKDSLPEIVLAKLNNDAGIIGAVIFPSCCK